MLSQAQSHWQKRLEEIEATANQTTSSRMLIMDVRKSTLPKLHQAYNKIIGYSRKDLNRYCFTVLIGDGPLNLFAEGKSPDVFVPYLAAKRVIYNPAVFSSTFLHYRRRRWMHMGKFLGQQTASCLTFS
jgi:hypothetical protein